MVHKSTQRYTKEHKGTQRRFIGGHRRFLRPLEAIEGHLEGKTVHARLLGTLEYCSSPNCIHFCSLAEFFHLK